MAEQKEFMSVKAFRALGYLQELNRQFLHPLGLAIEVSIDDKTGEESFGRIWDCRNDTDGLSYGDDMFSDPDFLEKIKAIGLLQRTKRIYKPLEQQH